MVIIGDLGNVGQQRGGVELGERLGEVGVGDEVGRVGGDQHAVLGDQAQQRLEVRAARVVADEPRDADVAVEVQVVAQLLLAAGEAEGHHRREARPELAQDGERFGVRIADVQHHGQLELGGELQLSDQELDLLCFLFSRNQRSIFS